MTAIVESLAPSKAPVDILRHRRLVDLAGNDTEHSWLWAINPAHGYVLTPDSFITALRLRLGVPVADYVGERPCAECGAKLSARELGNHALLCAKGKRTVGHNRIRDHFAALARVCDPSTVIEASPSSAPFSAGVHQRRPADILTSAAPLGGVGSVAVDIGITSPHVAEAARSPSHDPLDAYRTRKLAEYQDMCKAAGWDYRPLTLSAYARPHSDAVFIVHKLAVAASRAFGGSDAARTESAWWRNAATLLMERNARMVDCCLPTVDPPPIVSGVREAKWGEVPSRARRGAPVAAAALVSAGDGLRAPGGE